MAKVVTIVVLSYSVLTFELMQFLNLNGVAFVPWPARDKHEGFCMGRVNFSTSRSLTKAHIICVGNYDILHEAGVNKFHD